METTKRADKTEQIIECLIQENIEMLRKVCQRQGYVVEGNIKYSKLQ